MTVSNGAQTWCAERRAGIARSLVYSFDPRMSLTRPVAILVATVTLVSTSGVACAASSKLTLTPPPGLSAGPAKPKIAPRPSSPASSTSVSTTSASTTSAIPRTGSDLRLELLVAVLLVLVGALLRPRRLLGRR